MHTHANLVTSAITFAAAVGLSELSAGMVPGPMFHVNALGSAIPILVCGGRVVLMPRFEPGEVLRVIEQEKTTVTSLLPTILRMMVDHPDARTRDLSSMAAILYGAAPMPELLVQQAGKVFPNAEFKHCFGMTETTASVTTLPTRYVMPQMRELGKWRSAGRALLGMDLAVVDSDDRVLPAREHGEIVVRGPLVMKGYWNQPELTATTMRHGWLHTGDLGYIDEDGFIYIVDRLKDMIKSGGENIYSAEVETAIYSFAGVAQCAVIGIPDEKWGETVHAIVAASPGVTLDAGALLEHCRSQIARYKCPRSIELRDTPLPLTGVNKINKPALRAPFWANRPGTLV
jgi:long-chain acyl-CoA synthetase